MATGRSRHAFWLLPVVASGTLAAGAASSAYVVWLVAPCHVGRLGGRLTGVCGQDMWPHPGFPWVAAAILALLVVGWVVVGTAAVVRQLSVTRRMVRRLLRCSVPSSPRLVAAAKSAGVDRFVEVADSRAVAFCHGLLRPAVVVSSGMVERLSDDELKSVLVHEGCHVRRHDPFRVLAARTLAAIGFPFPVIRDLAAAAEVAGELEADSGAVAAVGLEPTARALLAAYDYPGPTLQPRVVVAGLDPTDFRIRHLIDGTVPSLGLSRVRIVVTAASMVALTIVATVATSASRAAAPTVTTTSTADR